MGIEKQQQFYCCCKNFDEQCIVMKQEKKEKLENLATPCIWLANSHAIGTYPVLSPKTRQLLLTQIAVFMNKSYFHDEKDDKQKEKITNKIMLKKRQIQLKIKLMQMILTTMMNQLQETQIFL